MRSDRGSHQKVAYSSFAFNQRGDQPRPTQLSDNLTEQLVQAEMERQFAALTPKVVRFLKRADIMAYALNRLPALYASTNKGRQKQEKYAYDTLHAQVEVVVRQAISAVINDPLRTHNDSWQPPERPKTEEALTKISTLLKFDCSWNNLVDVIKYRLTQAARGEFYLDAAELMDWNQHPLHRS
jgi:hypothetical protein